MSVDLDDDFKKLVQKRQVELGLSDAEMAKYCRLPLRTYLNFLQPHHQFTIKSMANLACRMNLKLTIKMRESK